MIPKIDDVKTPLLAVLSDGKLRAFRPLLRDVLPTLRLSPSDATKRSATSGRTLVSIRVSQALQQMIHDGLVENPDRSRYRISANGKRLLSGKPPHPSQYQHLEVDLEKELLRVYSRAGSEVGYWARYFLRAIRKRGAVAVAKSLLQPTKVVSKGFQALLDAGRADLSMEAVVVRPKFAPLFTSAEIAEARRRLSLFPTSGKRRVVPPERVHPETLSPSVTYVEGAVTKVLVNAYERDVRARKECLRHHGYRCSACDMSFEDRYGRRGKAFIHVHHKKPLAASRGGYVVDPIKDLIPVCPNCHAMLHTVEPPLSVAELRRELRRPSGAKAAAV